MEYSEWEAIYDSIVDDMGYSKTSDEAAARLLKVVMSNADLIDEAELVDEIGDSVAVIGPCNPNLNGLEGKIVIAAGSATECLFNASILPHIVVTDLDGDIESQIWASKKGSVTFIHAHGDNEDLIMRYARDFTGPVVLTTQSIPDLVLVNHGGFTDGDRAVCLARHYGVTDIELRGFDFDKPVLKDGSSPEVKCKKLAWAKRIIFGDLDEASDIRML